MEHNIPLSIPNFSGNEKQYVDEAVSQGWVSTGGAFITRLEEKLAEYLRAPGVAACQSGTAALHLSLIQCGVQPGDLVIVPTVTFIAAVNPVRYQFAEPVFMDCDDSLCLDPQKLRRFCATECELQGERLIHRQTGRPVKAVIVVHVFGNLADMEQIMEIARQFHLKVIEDATEALGSYFTEGRFRGMYAGTIGDFGAYSFNGNKIITTGGGGAVTARDAEAVGHMRFLSTQAKDDPHYYIHNEIGYNYRMTNLQAALGVAQLEELDGFIQKKHCNFELYKELVRDFKLGRFMEFRKGTYSNQWFYSFCIAGDIELRDLIESLDRKGVQTRPVWGLVHEQVPYRGAVAYEIKEAPYYSRHILNLPCSTQITEEEIHYTADMLKAGLEELSGNEI